VISSMVHYKRRIPHQDRATSQVLEFLTRYPLRKQAEGITRGPIDERPPGQIEECQQRYRCRGVGRHRRQSANRESHGLQGLLGQHQNLAAKAFLPIIFPSTAGIVRLRLPRPLTTTLKSADYQPRPTLRPNNIHHMTTVTLPRYTLAHLAPSIRSPRTGFCDS
jgi:hypothetical protein